MSPDGLTRAELEARMDQLQRAVRVEIAEVRSELRLSQEQQNSEWNQGLRQLREDLHKGRDALRDDIQAMLREFVRNDVFVARLSPIQSIAYGIVALVVALVTGILGMAIAFRKG